MSVQQTRVKTSILAFMSSFRNNSPLREINTPAAAVHDLPTKASQPLSTHAEIDDNSLLLESLLFDFAEIVSLSPLGLIAYSNLNRAIALNGVLVDYIVLREASQTPYRADLDDVARMYDWIHAKTLPVGFRYTFISHVIRVGELEDTIAQLSQKRWDDLRHWVHAHG